MKEYIIENKIGEKIDEYTKRTGATKTWIAKQMGISRQTLNSLINSKNPTIESMESLADALGCDIKDLYEKVSLRKIRFEKIDD